MIDPRLEVELRKAKDPNAKVTLQLIWPVIPDDKLAAIHRAHPSSIGEQHVALNAYYKGVKTRILESIKTFREFGPIKITDFLASEIALIATNVKTARVLSVGFFKDKKELRVRASEIPELTVPGTNGFPLKVRGNTKQLGHGGR